MNTTKRAWIGVSVAALGYFVDIYDMLLFSVVRVPSLSSLGFSGDEVLSSGVLLLNMQMLGMLCGGVLWGLLGDKQGRLSVLFGSILLYSSANIANAFVNSVESYALVRFLAGIGLAGELGAGITLVCESLPQQTRGYGTTIVTTFGVAGAVVAALVGDLLPWRSAYLVGGGLGIAILALRVAVHESGLFQALKNSPVRRGHLTLLFASRARVGRYLCCILIGLPIWFVVGILITFAPEFGKALRMPELPKAQWAVLAAYSGITCGDLVTGLLSQLVRSRKQVIAGFTLLTLFSILFYLQLDQASLGLFYGTCAALGFATGYWAVFVTTAAEQFGTNLRATVATTVPNFIRGSVVPLTTLFVGWKGTLGVINCALVLAVGTVIIALFCLWQLPESYHKQLDFLEE